ncbi:M10 family metallopeptidase C-terminal domain-containing protein [Pseudomonas yamanorum]|uniref:M10 family metallopeptidase C-terminal domain-containing protein n=1 Tax=Pseudomonas yamanorum TaxID=515393 RepID=UPI0015A07476|nr:M10 family metallopeptidase C-terminal domain-containing protein [Pseudomonas yamanorum]NVZ81101.1 M10 family metallopeptidase C-terminal domain-containing protein [Pseudomonas yamanorum]
MSNLQALHNSTMTNGYADNYSKSASEEPSKTPPSKGYGDGQPTQQSSGTGRKWHDLNNDGVTSLSYQNGVYHSSERGKGLLPFMLDESKVKSALQDWSDVANVTFTESKNPANEGHLKLAVHTYPNTPDGVPKEPGSEVVFFQTARGTDAPSISKQKIMREVGHAMGVQRPDHAPGSLMDDIEQAQKLYGANYNTRNTDTVYGFNSNADRDQYSLKDPDTYRMMPRHMQEANSAPKFSVWDGGGNDTFDFSKFTQDQTINLGAGTYSNVGSGVNNVSIARGVTIENAKGGTGNDKIIGNQANNVIVGGGGRDQLWGVGGNNTFKYNEVSDSTHDKADCLMDFVSGKDKIDITEAMSNAGVTPRLVQNFTGTPGDAVIGFHPTDKLYYLAIDTSGNGKTDFLIKSTKPIVPNDIVVPR